jgi:hypothetical protein
MWCSEFSESLFGGAKSGEGYPNNQDRKVIFSKKFFLSFVWLQKKETKKKSKS